MIHVIVYHNAERGFMPYEDGHRLNVATSHWLPDTDLDPHTVADWAWHAFNADLDMLEPDRATGTDGETTFLAAVVYRLLGHRSLSVGDVIEIRSGATTHWLACDPYGWRPITEPVNRGGTPLNAATVYRHLNARRTTR